MWRDAPATREGWELEIMYCTAHPYCARFSCHKPFSSPEDALLLVSTKNHDLWPSPTTEVRDSRTSRHSAHAQSQVWQIWLVLVSIVLTNPFKPGMSLDLARGRDSWCWPKGAWPLGRRMVISERKRTEGKNSLKLSSVAKCSFLLNQNSNLNFLLLVSSVNIILFN